MKKFLFAASLCLSLLIGEEASAIAVSYSGTNVGGPNWVRPFADGSCCSGLGPVRYEVQPFYTNFTGSYDVSSIQNGGWDGYIFIYHTSFNPNNQTANFVAGDDDGVGGIGTSNIDNVNLLSSTNYFLVTTAFELGEEGTFFNTISDDIGSALISLGLIPLNLPLNSSGYWDTNGATLGAGGPTPNGSWQDANWTTNIDGTSSTVNWTDGSDAIFSAGNDATSEFTVNLDSSVIVRDMAVRNGQVNIFATSPANTIVFSDPRDGESTITTASLTSLVFDTNVTSRGNLAKEGGGRIDFNNQTVVEGVFALREGTVYVNGAMTTGNTQNAGTLVVNGYLATADVDNSGTLLVNGKMESHDTDNSGTLIVDGMLVSSVNNRGYLGGSGVISGNVDNRGTISPGNSIGQLTIDGSYTQWPGATLLAEISESGRSDNLNITGKATLNGGTIRTSLPRGLYPDGFAWNILTAGGGVNGAFDSIQGQPNSETIDLVLVTTDKGVDIQVERTSYGSFGATIGQQKTGAGLDMIVPLARHRGDAMENLLVNMDFGASAQQIGEVLAAVNPEMYTSFKSTAGQTAQHFSSTLSDRNAKIREAELILTKTDVPKIGVSGIEVVSSEQDANKAGAGTQENTSEGRSFPVNDELVSPNWMAWGQFETTNSDRSGGGEYLGYDATTNGVLLGLDGKISSIWRLGFGFGASGTDIDWNQPGASGDQTGILAGVYSSVLVDRYYFDASLSFGTYDNDASRANPFGMNTQPISSEFTGISWSGQIGIGYDFLIGGNWILGPMASLNYLTLRSNDFNEKNADYLNLNLTFDEDTDETVITSLGGRVATLIEAWGVSFLPRFEFAWKHDENGDDQTVHTSFHDYEDIVFPVSGAGAGKDIFNMNIGVIALMNKRLSGNIQIASDLAEDYQSVALSCGLVVNF